MSKKKSFAEKIHQKNTNRKTETNFRKQRITLPSENKKEKINYRNTFKINVSQKRSNPNKLQIEILQSDSHLLLK